MQRAIKHHHNPIPESMPVKATVTLAYEDRHRRRIRMTDDDGKPFLLDLPHAVHLCDGDLLELEGGEAIRVCAAVEDVLDITCDGIEETARMAWHIGNRHVPIEIRHGGVLRIRYDHVLEQMICDNGGHCERVPAPFSPEPGAYHSSGEHTHAH